jgi:undecaprenyl-diphosphatase
MAVALWLVLAGVLIGVGELVERSGAVNSFDRHITAQVVARRTPALNGAMKVFTWVGSWVALAVVGTLLVVTVVRHRRWLLALPLALMAWAGTEGGVTLAKSVVTRPRPPQDLWLISAHGWAWPSGHTATATLVFIILALLLTTGRARRWWHPLVWLVAAGAVALTGFSRIELGVHWTTDVLAGAAFSVGWLVVLAALLMRFVKAGSRTGAPSGRNGRSLEHA